MRKNYIFALFFIGLILNGCETSVLSKLPEENIPETTITAFSEKESFEIPSYAVSTVPVTSTEVIQGGPYGKISISLPDGWKADTYSVDSEELMSGMYGIHFYPENVTKGYIELVYIDSFGVCGTGLDEKQVTINGNHAYIGTYDNHAYWDFITFQEDYAGIVALTYSVEDWWDTYSSEVERILNTVSFDPDIKEGSAYIFNMESEESKIGLSFSLKKISPTGATLVFRQYNTDAPTGELSYGEEYVIERQKNDIWEPVPVVIENYAFNMPAYIIAPNDTIEQEIRWEWLYGSLAPGNYRIKKAISDFRDTGDFDVYTLYAYFLVN